jgi:hypothetical protein
MITDIIENVFEYDLTGLELEVLGLLSNDETSYLLSNGSPKILSDLHLLFLMRNDKVNGDRVMGKIKILGKWA